MEQATTRATSKEQIAARFIVFPPERSAFYPDTTSGSRRFSPGFRTQTVTMISIMRSSRFRDWFYLPEQKYIPGNAHKQKYRRCHERPRKGTRCLHDVARDDRRGNSGKLIAKIQNSSQRADTFSRSNQRRNRPSHRRSGGQSADRYADPQKRRDRSLRPSRAQNAEAERRSANEHNLTTTNRVPAALYQRIHQPATDDEIGERGEQPRHTGIKRRMKQIHAERRRKIRRHPSQEQIESVIIGSEAQRQPPHFTPPQQVEERGAFGRSRAILRLRSAANDEVALRRCQ